MPRWREARLEAIRPARRDEVAALNELIAIAARELSRGYYTAAQIESLITHVFGVDTQLLEDQSYYVIEHEGRPAACGGWSRRRTLFGGDQTKHGADPGLDPATDAARIRAFFVHPSRARQGLGRRLLAHCEDAAKGEGFRRVELMATLPGRPFYAALGYEAFERVDHPLPGRGTATFIRMGRVLT